MVMKESNMDMRSDADLQAIQTSVAFKNISDAVEQYRRQFGLAFLALIAFSAIHVGLVVIANLYTMQTRVASGVLTDASDNHSAVATGSAQSTFDLSYIMSNLDEQSQIRALNDMKDASFLDRDNQYRSYTVTGFQLGGYKRSELKLYTSVGHVLEFVRGKGLKVYSEGGQTSQGSNATDSRRRQLLQKGAGAAPSNSMLDSMTRDALSDLVDVTDQVIENAMTAVRQEGQSEWGCNTPECIDRKIRSILEPALANLERSGVSRREMALQEQAALRVMQQMETAMETAMDGDAILMLTPDMLTPDNNIGNEIWDRTKTRYGNKLSDGMIAAMVAQDVLVTIQDSVHVAFEETESYMDGQTNGFFGSKSLMDAGARASRMTQRSPEPGEYGCTGKQVADFMEYDSQAYQIVDHMCIAGGGDMRGGNPHVGNILGGFFFSAVLGTYEAFLVHTSSGFCGHYGGITSKNPTPSSTHGEYYVYMMHGWGETSHMLYEARNMLDLMQQASQRVGSRMIRTEGFLTICAEDAGSPYGGKTYYTNNAFSGYHLDMLAFELPNFIESSFGAYALGKAAFGFSMGAIGAMNIGLTYSNVFNGIAAFNAAMDMDTCSWYGYCHVYCGVNAIKCEMMWTSAQTAYNPYVIVGANTNMATMSYYDPVANGLAAHASQNGLTACQRATGGTSVVSTTTGRFRDVVVPQVNVGFLAALVGNFFDSDACTGDCTLHQYEGQYYHINMDITDVSAEFGNNFYLDPIKFTRSMSSFDPTHNPVTGEIAETLVTTTDRNIQSGKQAFYNMFSQMPVPRIAMAGDMFSTDKGHMFIFSSCDPSDQFGLFHSHNALSDILDRVQTVVSGPQRGTVVNPQGAQNKIDLSARGTFIHDEYNEDCGHCMTTRDYRIAYSFFSDVFETAVESIGSKECVGGHCTRSLIFRTSPTPPVFMHSSLISLKVNTGLQSVSFGLLDLSGSQYGENGSLRTVENEAIGASVTREAAAATRASTEAWAYDVEMQMARASSAHGKYQLDFDLCTGFTVIR